jgi:hypothetical protein
MLYRRPADVIAAQALGKRVWRPATAVKRHARFLSILKNWKLLIPSTLSAATLIVTLLK